MKMVHRILTVVDKNSTKEKFAVLVNLVDWNNAFPRQCPKLGIESFFEKCGPAFSDTLPDELFPRETNVNEVERCFF